MPTASNNFGEYIGVSNFFAARVSADTTASYTTETPWRVAPVASVAADPQVAVKTRYYDNRSYFTTTTEGETKITFVISGVDSQTKAKLIGKTYDTTSKRLIDNGELNPDYYAAGFKTDVEGGSKYFWFLKGKFQPYKEEAATKTTDIDEKNTTLEFTAVCTEHAWNGKVCKSIEGDTRLDSTIVDGTGTGGWFAAVQHP